MNKRKIYTKIFFAIISMILLIAKPATAIKGATEGIDICIKAVIPALFPFFIVTTYLNTSLLGHSIPLLLPVRKMLKTPNGGDSLLLLGLIGGYPVGAQLIAQAYQHKQISKRTGKILLGYCNNAGPAFIFGMAASMFHSAYVSIILWVSHIISALITGYLLPRPEFENMYWKYIEEINITSALKKSLSICSIVCGWIVLFKVALSYLNVLLISFDGNTAEIIISGFMELSNGCLQLVKIPSMSLRFILCSAFLAFGGLCVIFQTASAAESIGLGLYIHGKILQTSISTIASILLTYILFPNDSILASQAGCVIILCAVIIIITKGAAKKYGNSLQDVV